MAYLGFHKEAKFSLATSDYTKGAKPGFPIFPYGGNFFFCQWKAMAQWPPKYATLSYINKPITESEETYEEAK